MRERRIVHGRKNQESIEEKKEKNHEENQEKFREERRIIERMNLEVSRED